MNPKYEGPRLIVVAGGVISGVGKGTATASIGKILQQYGYSATAIKIDPYINYDAGTLRPTEHGEVWVTDDGGEIDQDLGNYERLLGIDIPKRNNLTTGQIYRTVINRERGGEYLGQTVRPIPHITDEIKRRVLESAVGFDIALVEVGGTVGDDENEPFLFAMKGLEREIGELNVIYILVTYLPVPSHIGEMKTKPTQQAIKLLSEHGIFPDFVLCRANEPLDEVRKKKIEISANIAADSVISAPDIQTLYDIPLNLEKDGIGRKILEKFGLEPRKSPDWTNWQSLVRRIRNPSKTLCVAMVGKYVDIGDYSLMDSYISINQSLEHAGAAFDVGIDIDWIDSKGIEEDDKGTENLREFDGIIVPGGFGGRGVEGKIEAIKFVRENKIPFLGLCYGLQLAVVEFARNVCGMNGAHTTEIDPSTEYAVIDTQPGQREVIEKREYGGTMRLGAYAAVLKRGSLVYELYRKSSRLEEDSEKIETMKKDKDQVFRLGLLHKWEDAVLERHRHRYEVSPLFIELFEDYGLVFSGYHKGLDGAKLMEFVELPKHRFFVATQAHPEFKSRLEKPAPLFLGFVEAMLKCQAEYEVKDELHSTLNTR